MLNFIVMSAKHFAAFWTIQPFFKFSPAVVNLLRKAKVFYHFVIS